MNDDYLWDKTGEPDAEVQQLEDVLGTLRYQPHEFELPVEVRTGPRRRTYLSLAVAATIALMVLAAGAWSRLHRQEPTRTNEVITAHKEETPDLSIPTPKQGNEVYRKSRDEDRNIAWRRNPTSRANRTARNTISIKPSVPPDEMSATEIAEAEAAKDQLMLALRVVSAKLNLAQRKTQIVPPANNIRYQHKLG